MKAVIIGGTGVIGRYLVDSLKSSGHEVVLFGGKHTTTSDHAIPIDVVTDPIPIPPGTDMIYYLAQSPHYRQFPDNMDDLFAVNTLGALRVMDVALKTGCQAFVYASSGSVYVPSKTILDEHSPLNRSAPYSLSKIQAEEALSLFKYDIRVISVRLFSVFGPKQENKLAGSILNTIRSGQPVVINDSDADGAGAKISWTYGPDLGRQLVQLGVVALSTQSLPDQLNMASPTSLTIKEFAERVGHELNEKVAFEFSKALRPLKGDLVADIALMQKVLSPNFTPFNKAIKQFVHG